MSKCSVTPFGFCITQVLRMNEDQDKHHDKPICNRLSIKPQLISIWLGMAAQLWTIQRSCEKQNDSS